jgi:predicted DNA-binding protein
MEPRKFKTTSVRMPPELYERLVKAAVENRRSLNNEIVYRLERKDEKENA